jgi:hypothetical protein
MTLPCGLDEAGKSWTGYTARVGAAEERFRYGYKVIGCEPRLLGTGDQADAEARAMNAAADVSEKLVRLGGPAEVEWWIQRVVITGHAAYEPPIGALITEDDVAALHSPQLTQDQ